MFCPRSQNKLKGHNAPMQFDIFSRHGAPRSVAIGFRKFGRIVPSVSTSHTTHPEGFLHTHAHTGTHTSQMVDTNATMTSKQNNAQKKITKKALKRFPGRENIIAPFQRETKKEKKNI